MNKINGGPRPGSGRKASFEGEKTKPVRIPESQIPVVLGFLEGYRQRKGGSGTSALTFDERFAYELEIARVKGELADVTAYLRESFRHIPIVAKKINALQTALDMPRKAPLARTAPRQLQVGASYSAAGVPWFLSSTLEKQKVVFLSTPPSPALPHVKVTDPHRYQLGVEEIDSLIDFLLAARQFI